MGPADIGRCPRKTSDTSFLIMKTSNSKTDSQKLVSTVQTARLRVATAENRWQAAKQQARAAKRRRKEIKLIARRARKQAKRAKADLADAREALAKAEAKLGPVRPAPEEAGKASRRHPAKKRRGPPHPLLPSRRNRSAGRGHGQRPVRLPDRRSGSRSHKAQSRWTWLRRSRFQPRPAHGNAPGWS